MEDIIFEMLVSYLLFVLQIETTALFVSMRAPPILLSEIPSFFILYPLSSPSIFLPSDLPARFQGEPFGSRWRDLAYSLP